MQKSVKILLQFLTSSGLTFLGQYHLSLIKLITENKWNSITGPPSTGNETLLTQLYTEIA